jgi:hypothetical protein
LLVSAQKQLNACKRPSPSALRKIRNVLGYGVDGRDHVLSLVLFWQGSLVLGIPFAVAQVVVPEGVPYLSRIEDAADFIPDPVVFFAVCVGALVQLGEGDAGQVDREGSGACGRISQVGLRG